MLEFLSRIIMKCQLLTAMLFYKIIPFKCLKIQVLVLFVFCLFAFKKLRFSLSASGAFFLRPLIIALGQKHPAGVIDSAAANRINQASVITLTKQSVDSGKNFSTSLVAENKNGDVFLIS